MHISGRGSLPTTNRCLGTLQDTIAYTLTTLTPYGKYVYYMAHRQYELTNHLGNVLATVSDVKTFSSTGYRAKVLSAQNYYPFGMQMPNKNYNLPTYSSLNKYRYGFNGQERETEINLSITSAEFWMYDGRLGRRWNVDPVLYPWHGGYTVLNSNPILYNDPNGDNPPAGWKTYSNKSGYQVALPPSAKVETYKGGEKIPGTNRTAIPGALRAFTIDKSRFVAAYNIKNGNFVGYKNFISGKLYKSPDVKISGSFTSNPFLNSDGTQFTVTTTNGQTIKPSANNNFVGADIQTTDYNTGQGINAGVIQTFDGSKKVIGDDVGSFVDGGRNSPAAKDATMIPNLDPEYLTKPYYPTSLSKGILNSINFFDSPSAVCFHLNSDFETSIVAKNFNGTGADYILGSFKWGYTTVINMSSTPSINVTAKHGIGISLSTISKKSSSIIKKDYPNYNFKY